MKNVVSQLWLCLACVAGCGGNEFYPGNVSPGTWRKPENNSIRRQHAGGPSRESGAAHSERAA